MKRGAGVRVIGDEATVRALVLLGQLVSGRGKVLGRVSVSGASLDVNALRERGHLKAHVRRALVALGHRGLPEEVGAWP